MITLRKTIGRMALGLAALLGGLASAQAQGSTILAGNADLKNELIFATVQMPPSSCQSFQLQFTLKNKKTGHDFGKQKILGVLGMPVTYTARTVGGGAGASGTLSFETHETTGNAIWAWAAETNNVKATLINGDTTMSNLMAETYDVVFELPGSNLGAGDSVEVCMISILSAATCTACGVNNTNLVFTSANIASGCSYPNTANDLIACYTRQSRAGNEEAWIVDNRDCHPYRIVKMPDGRWWMAQNLNYHSANDPANGGYASKSPNWPQWQLNAANTASGGNAANNTLRSIWCPGGVVINSPTNSEPSSPSSGAAACKTYGALYPWATAMSLDGEASSENDPVLQYAAVPGAASEGRGVCPNGWYIPSRYDWGKMLNMIEATNSSESPTDGENPGSGNGKTLPCFHNYTTTANAGWAGSRSAYKDLLSTDVGRFRGTGGAPALAGTITNYADSTNRATFLPGRVLLYPTNTLSAASDTDPQWSYFMPETAGTDRYGFSIKPAGVSTPTAMYSRGQFAGFWTSSHADASQAPTAATTAFMVGFRYNYRHNADINSGIMSWDWSKKYGLSVRCIAAESGS